MIHGGAAARSSPDTPSAAAVSYERTAAHVTWVKRQQDQGGLLNRLIGALRAAQAPAVSHGDRQHLRSGTAHPGGRLPRLVRPRHAACSLRSGARRIAGQRVRQVKDLGGGFAELTYPLHASLPPGSDRVMKGEGMCDHRCRSLAADLTTRSSVRCRGVGERMAVSGDAGQERGWCGSSGTDPGPITPNDVTSAGVMTFRPQSASTRARFPAMAMRW